MIFETPVKDSFQIARERPAMPAKKRAEVFPVHVARFIGVSLIRGDINAMQIVDANTVIIWNSPEHCKIMRKRYNKLLRAV